MDTPELDKLIRRCLSSAIDMGTPDLRIETDNADNELAALKSALTERDALLAEAGLVIAPLTEVIYPINEKDDSLKTIVLSVGDFRAASELAKKLEGLK